MGDEASVKEKVAISDVLDFRWTVMEVAEQVEMLKPLSSFAEIKQVAARLQAVVHHPFVTNNREVMDIINHFED